MPRSSSWGSRQSYSSFLTRGAPLHTVLFSFGCDFGGGGGGGGGGHTRGYFYRVPCLSGGVISRSAIDAAITSSSFCGREAFFLGMSAEGETTSSVDAASAVGEGGGGGGESFPTVTLDPDAVQKFAEIEVRWAGQDSSDTPTMLIRGLESAAYHKDAAAPTMELLKKAGAAATITGGGRIKHSTGRKSIFVYGYSMQFGQANLSRVADLCRDAYPGYDVTWSEGGY